MKYLILIVLILLSVQIFADDKSPEVFGWQMPYPKIIPSEIPKYKHLSIRKLKEVEIILEVGKNGEVTNIILENHRDSLLLQYYQENLLNIKFEPARKNSEKTECKIPLNLLFTPKNRKPILQMALDTINQVVNYSLYHKFFELNEVNPPELLNFPSYFSDMEYSDRSLSYPIIVLSVNLNDKGELTAIDTLFSTYKAFNFQLLSATLNASFSPLYISDVAKESHFYLLISFFSYVKYPTDIWESDILKSYNSLDKFRLRISYDTTGLYSPPVPSFYPPNKIISRNKLLMSKDSIQVMVSITEEGLCRMWAPTYLPKKLRKPVRDVVSKFQFYPAINFHGEPKKYSGMISLVFNGSGNIRIHYHWLQ